MTDSDYGKNLDGSSVCEYCKYCYYDGKIGKVKTVEEMLENCILFLIDENTSKEVVRLKLNK